MVPLSLKGLSCQLWSCFVINDPLHKWRKCQPVPTQRQPSCLALSYCIHALAPSPPLNIAYSRAIIIPYSISSPSHFFNISNSSNIFSLNPFIHPSIHPSSPFSPAASPHFYLPSSMFPSPFPFVRPTLFLPSLYLVLWPFPPSFPPSLLPGTVYNLPLFFSSFLPLPSFSSCSLTLLPILVPADKLLIPYRAIRWKHDPEISGQKARLWSWEEP